MKILVVPIELPLPANSGGRIDVTRRLRALRDGGHETALLTWQNVVLDGPVAQPVMAELGNLCTTHHIACIRRGAVESLRRLGHLGRLPSYAAARWVTLDRPAVLAWARAFAPDVLLLDGLYGMAAVRWLARELRVPWAYRAHNIEHRYMRYQHRQAAGLGARLRLSANLLGLRRAEQAVVDDAMCTFDISPADADHWRAHGARRVQWLPTVVDADFEAAMHAASAQPPQWDIVYFGNLHTPNNVEAVRWLLTQVLPLLGPVLSSLAPGRPLRVALAGSRPSEAVKRLAQADPRVTLLADPPSVPAIAGAARVLVNPVQGGSGVNLKSVEMLFSTSSLVSTPAGVQGLPADAAACFSVCADAPSFARAVAQALEDSAGSDAAAQARARADARVRARAPFAPACAMRVLTDTLRALLEEARR